MCEKYKIIGKISVYAEGETQEIFITPDHKYTYKTDTDAYACFLPGIDNKQKNNEPILKKMNDQRSYKLTIKSPLNTMLQIILSAANSGVSVALTVENDDELKLVACKIPAYH
ncbi:MAG: hypothetical protein KBE01_01675 [Synergistaceae bacterium]|nr:hypothetical protein [Synergistaceae bacterium]